MTDYSKYTMMDLMALGKVAETYFGKELGYDETEFKRVWLNGHGGHRIEFMLHDTFQHNLPIEMQYKDGWAIMLDLDDTFWDKVTTWPTREQRELTILARKMTAIDADLGDIRSAQVLAFIARLQPDIDALRRQIADLRGESNTVEVS